MTGNQTRGSFEQGHYALFEQLPPPLQDLLRYADANYKAGWVLHLHRSLGLKRGYAVVRDRLRAEMRADLVRDYGRDHPSLARR